MREPTRRGNFRSGSSSLEASYYQAATQLGPAPVVMILTGDGERGSLSSTWSPVIEGLLERGVNSYIFDFQGQGRSGGERRQLSIESGRRNFLDALSHLEGLVQKRSIRLGIFGSSFGASVVLHSLGRITRDVHCLAFKSPAVDLAAAYERDHGSFASLVDWRRHRVSSTTGLGYDAYTEALSSNLLRGVSEVRCPVLIVHGSADQLVPIHQSWRLANALGDWATLIELPGVGHGYKEAGALDSLIAHTASFFVQHLMGEPQS